MKLTNEGMPLLHLTLPHQINSIGDYCHNYLLINEDETSVDSAGSTPNVESIYMNPTILNDFAFITTRAIPVKKSHRNMESGIIVGRNRTCDIVVNSSEVSRRHLRILTEGDLAFVENLSETNGLILNGMKKEIAKLESQTIMCLGGLVGAVFISAPDLQMLCSMLPDHWRKLNIETRTSMEIPNFAPLA